MRHLDLDIWSWWLLPLPANWRAHIRCLLECCLVIFPELIEVVIVIMEKRVTGCLLIC
jgi:hypothetical protein